MAQKPKALCKISRSRPPSSLSGPTQILQKDGQSKELAKRQIIKGLKSAQSFKSDAAFPGKQDESESVEIPYSTPHWVFVLLTLLVMFVAVPFPFPGNQKIYSFTIIREYFGIYLDN